MDAWQSFARISGVAFQVFAAVLVCILVGVGIDHLVPALGNIGALVGGALGFIAAIYVMVTGLRAYVNSEPPPPKIEPKE
ncbi:MAG TPA: AtpZ/AtpI family protein [Candidatus Dormibacteraeota bacterium]|nr:AtpZ/AtpI family protein [Candidatus Dormibacteraeota bacterium]